jgi:FkbM family methyltransferase
MSEKAWDKAFALADRIDCRVIFDAGASAGTVTKRVMERFPNAKVYAFEPDPRVFRHVSKLFTTPAKGQAFNVALGAKKGRVMFHRGASRGISSLFPRNVEGRRYFRRQALLKQRFAVPVESIDSVCADNGIENIDLLKMDTQGAELAILRGADRLLSKGAISIIVTEFYFIPHYDRAPLLDSIWTYLRQRGYHIFDLFVGPHATNGQARYGDAIFVSPDFRKTVLDAMPEEP